MDGFSGNRNRSKTPYAASPEPRFLLGKRVACFSVFSSLPPLPVFFSPLGRLSGCFFPFRPLWRYADGVLRPYPSGKRIAPPVFSAFGKRAIWAVRCRFPFPTARSGAGFQGSCQPAESGMAVFFPSGTLFSGDRAGDCEAAFRRDGSGKSGRRENESSRQIKGMPALWRASSPPGKQGNKKKLNKQV